MHLLSLCILCVVLLLCSSTFSWAQLPTSEVNGIITDPHAALVSGAKVSLTSNATGAVRTQITGHDGRYSFTQVDAGTYDLRVEASGFAVREFKAIELEVGRALTVDVPLRVAKAGEAVLVSATLADIDLTQSQVAGQVSATTIQNIPLNGRNFLELAYLLPGNRPAANYDPTKTNTLEVSSAGAFGRGGNITVDGADNNDEVVGGTLMNFPQDGVREFQIATNRFSAEVGRSGSSIVNIITKSGTNELHGSGFIFFRHKELQALPATFQRVRPDGTRVPKPSFDREQFGGSLGGPIKRDKAFWFAAVEYRNQDAVVEVGQRDFATNTVVATSAPAPLDDLLLNARVDFLATEKNSFFLRYGYNRSEDISNGSLARPLGTAANRQSSENTFHSGVLDWTSVLSPNLVNSISLHLNLFDNSIPRFPDDEPLTNPGGLAVGNEIRFTSVQDGANFRIPQGVDMNRYQLKDNLSWKAGKHSWKFGVEYQHIGNNALFDLFGSGSISTTEDFASQDRNRDGVINDLDIPIANVLQSAAPNRPPFVPFYRTNYFGWYLQDDWRVSPRLTLNLGLRWEWDSNVFAEGEEHQPCPDLTTQPTVRCVWLRNVLGKHEASGLTNFAPRIGFAWDPLGEGNTVIRGGYGIYYDRVVTEVNLLESLLDGRILPLGAFVGSTCGGGDCSAPGAVFDPGTPTLANPLVGAVDVFGIGINFIDNEAKHPYVQQFNIGLDQSFGENWVASADGIYNFGQRLLIGRLLRDSPVSSPLLDCPAPATPCEVTDPLTGRTDRVTVIGSFAKSWFSGLLASVRRRPTGAGPWRWGFNVNYTLSKSFDYANDDQIPFNTEVQTDLFFGVNDLALEKGYSLIDERHRLTVYGVFDMPWGLNASPIYTFGSGVPMDSFVPELNTRLPNIRRNALGREIENVGELNQAIAEWNALPICSAGPVPCNTDGAGGMLLLSPVALPSDTTFGDTFHSLDLRITKSFTAIREHQLQLIGEVFNLFNVTNIRGFNNRNFAGFNPDITSDTFNVPLRTAGGFFGSGGPRAFQLALRYTF